MTLSDAPQFRDGAHYEPIERIGAGAMGDVWLARDKRRGERVVLKVMHGHLPDQLIDRLRLEAQALERMVHPNIVHMLDWGTTKDFRPFIVLEYLIGKPLDVLMKERTLSLAEAVQLVIELLSALSAVHEAGMVHRDVKPSNAFVCQPGGTLKLLDFGIIKIVETISGVAPLQIPTKAGAAIGTPIYMSPEQVRGKPIDGRADVYSAGIVLYELVAGHPFADATKLEQMMLAHATRTPSPPSTVARQPIPPRLDGIILKALAKDRDQRFADAHEMARALESFARDFLVASGPKSSAEDATVLVPESAGETLPSDAPPEPEVPAPVVDGQRKGVGPIGEVALAFVIAFAVVIGLYLAVVGSW